MDIKIDSQLLVTWCKMFENPTLYIYRFYRQAVLCRHKCADTYCIKIKYSQMGALSWNVLCNVMCNVMCCNIGDIVTVRRCNGELTWCRCVSEACLFGGGITVKWRNGSLLMELKWMVIRVKIVSKIFSAIIAGCLNRNCCCT